ncbi:MAG: YihY/virulence factor BrkB family protein [Myxococcales bacterium]|nr:YihY/virulence factor BrkB family protein [Myxococcales bacterium]MCB9581614.1 YihY/virulence factor BrkB family protein [Polyangiaceae bacterium]
MTDARGREAKTPRQIPWRGLVDVGWRVWREAFDDKLTIVAAGVAFFGMIAIFPALIAVVSVYGLLFDPHDVLGQMRDMAPALPWSARRVVMTQLSEIVQGSGTQLGFGLVSSLVFTIVGASSGMHALIDGINHAYDEKETRSWFRVRATALGFTMIAIVFVVISIALIAVLPPMLPVHVGSWVSVLRWPALGGAFILGLSWLYRHAPNRRPPRWQWVSFGAVFATGTWLLVSWLFSLYAQSFGRFNHTYGTLGGAIVLLLWMFLSSLAILLGAELNAELEHQTEVDTTIGPERPMGERHAFMADTVGPSAPKRVSRLLVRGGSAWRADSRRARIPP